MRYSCRMHPHDQQSAVLATASVSLNLLGLLLLALLRPARS